MVATIHRSGLVEPSIRRSGLLRPFRVLDSNRFARARSRRRSHLDFVGAIDQFVDSTDVLSTSRVGAITGRDLAYVGVTAARREVEFG
jgi:hypothetical protein